MHFSLAIKEELSKEKRQFENQALSLYKRGQLYKFNN